MGRHWAIGWGEEQPLRDAAKGKYNAFESFGGKMNLAFENQKGLGKLKAWKEFFYEMTIAAHSDIIPITESTAESHKGFLTRSNLW